MNSLSRLLARTWIAVSLLMLVPVSLSTQAPAAGRLRVGAAKVDVTPDPGPNDRVRDRLYVRALYVEDGRSSAVIVTVDAGGVGNDIVNAAVAQSSAATGCPPDNYLISATHTHSSGAGRPHERPPRSCPP